jgi:hypothetical protein
LPRLACNARLRRTQLLDRQGIARSENRSVYTSLPNCVIHLRASVLDPWSIRGSRTQSSSSPCHTSQNHQSIGWLLHSATLQAPKPEQHSRLRRDAIPLPFFSHHHTSIFLLPNVPLRTAPTCPYTKPVPPCILTLRL